MGNKVPLTQGFPHYLGRKYNLDTLGVHLWEVDFVDFTSEGDREVVDSSWVDSVIATATSVIAVTVSVVSGTKTGPKNKN